MVESKKRRFFIELAYKGTQYHGWQIQKNAVSVQEVLEKALTIVFHQTVQTIGCGRTDTGVHARQLFAHFDLDVMPKGYDLDRWLYSINSLLPFDVAVKGLWEVNLNNHARFDALSRSYEYHIHFEKDPFLMDFSWQLKKKPDIEVMNQAAVILKDYTDFSCFSKSHTQVFTNNCIISDASWSWIKEDRLVFTIQANRFLRNMVRAIVGTLLEVGFKEYPPERLHSILESKDRSLAGASVPAHGLFLTQVTYPFALKGGSHG